MTGTIAYRVNLSGSGWLDWVEDAREGGSSQGAMPLEAVSMKLTGELGENYDVLYSVLQNQQWTDWMKNGEEAGVSGAGLRLDGIRISIVKKNEGGNTYAGNIDPTKPMLALTYDCLLYTSFIVAQANEPLDEEGHFIHNNVSGRFREETSEFQKKAIDLMDVSPKMVFSVATSMIPFLENDDANRALMGSNMQRQAVPLLSTEAPVVGTGIEAKADVYKRQGLCQYGNGAGKPVSGGKESGRQL